MSYILQTVKLPVKLPEGQKVWDLHEDLWCLSHDLLGLSLCTPVWISAVTERSSACTAATSPAKTWGENGGSFKCWGCHVSTFNMTQSWCQKKGHVAELFGGQILFGTGPNVYYQTNFGPLLSEVSNPETGTSLRQEDNDESENKGQQVWDAPVTTNNSQPSLEIAGSQAMQ